MHIRFSTTSDWTDLLLVSGATWESFFLISSDEKAIVADIQDGMLILNQPLDRAKAGGSVEMLVFKVERGDIGTSSVDFRYSQISLANLPFPDGQGIMWIIIIYKDLLSGFTALPDMKRTSPPDLCAV